MVRFLGLVWRLIESSATYGKDDRTSCDRDAGASYLKSKSEDQWQGKRALVKKSSQINKETTSMKQ
jgi:hypothetical protein